MLGFFSPEAGESKEAEACPDVYEIDTDDIPISLLNNSGVRQDISQKNLRTKMHMLMFKNTRSLCLVTLALHSKVNKTASPEARQEVPFGSKYATFLKIRDQFYDWVILSRSLKSLWKGPDGVNCLWGMTEASSHILLCRTMDLTSALLDQDFNVHKPYKSWFVQMFFRSFLDPERTPPSPD